MNYEKIAPELIAAVEDYSEVGWLGLTRYLQPLGIVRSREKLAQTIVFVHCDAKADLTHLTSYGIQVNQSVGSVRTAFLPLESLAILSEAPTVRRIIPSRRLRPYMDTAPGKVHMPAFVKKTKLTGKDVIIGVIDSGIDSNHPAFVDRILRVWDQTLHGSGVAEGGYGVEFRGSFAGSRDTNGHGTHVAGIAAGNDRIYGGAASEAKLVIVKSDLLDAHIADGIRYIFRVAQEFGSPAVINLSVGSHADAHDGTDSLSQVIDAETGKGRIVCCAAGNEAKDNIHAQLSIPQGQERSVYLWVPTSSGSSAIYSTILNGWYSGKDQVEVAVQSPGGFRTPYQGVISSGNPIQMYNLPDGRVRISTPGLDSMNGDHRMFVEIRHSNQHFQPLTAGVWRLWLRGQSIYDGQIDIWIMDDSYRRDVIFIGDYVHHGVKIGAPGAAKSAITVASYTTKVRWLDLDGSQQYYAQKLDDISDFSNEGPLRNGTEKPDVAAPGAMIVSCFSADSHTSVPRPYWIDQHYRVMSGTSMATPFVAGVAALLLEREPMLDPLTVKTRLRSNSNIPGKAKGTFHSKWGFGLIDLSRL